MPFGKQRRREHKRKEEITTSLSHVLAATEKEKRKYKSLDMQDVSRCQSDDEVMQVDHCIPPSILIWATKASENRDVSLAKIWVGAIFWLGSWEGCTRR